MIRKLLKQDFPDFRTEPQGYGEPSKEIFKVTEANFEVLISKVNELVDKVNKDAPHVAWDF